MQYPHLSPYSHCANNPLTYVNPDGRKNLEALQWAKENMVNKGIKTQYQNPWFGGSDNRWTYQIGSIPSRAVCYEACFMAYLNSGERILSLLQTGFTNKNNAFYGRNSGMDWFKAGDGNDRSFVTDITKGESGDILFMGESEDMEGHAALLIDAPEKTIIIENGQEIEEVKLTVYTVSSVSEKGSFGQSTYYFRQNDNGDWYIRNMKKHYLFNGYGQLNEQSDENND